MHTIPQLTQMIEFAPTIQSLVIRDTAIAVTDLHEYVYYAKGKELNHHVKPGDPVKPGSLVEKAMTLRQKQTSIVDVTLFGTPYIGTAIPLIDPKTQEVVGSLFIGESTEKQELLKNMAKELSSNVSDITDSTRDISKKADQFSVFSNQLAELTHNFNKKIGEINSFTSMIQNISKKSNMLGINAAIESARIGEQGRGFAVVAEEISKLSKQSNDSVISISDMTRSILADSESLNNETDILTGLSDEIMLILNSLTQNIEAIYGMVEELTSISESL
ncbi:methyl-accepting chemotaxis protein [Fusibacter bizertensis]|uniref:Methyl-accepting chemotaxis protein n=1 Tax=Fusibacter bizertensis TaxID=1488331 RepID=A0ABT6NDP3_9FIRM|nr:methyl-accepting chemotaxis protein [Fusibacter bizertensis]MDH8678516.1 methyl-accepting chemotaxis protein [Fusibacter bizertensis]